MTTSLRGPTRSETRKEWRRGGRFLEEEEVGTVGRGGTEYFDQG